MIAFLVLLLAAASRFVPHAMHGTGLNITAVGGGLLYFGARRPRWQIPIAMLVMALTDIALTLGVYGYPFHWSDYALTWLWYGATCFLGSGLLRRSSAARLLMAVVASATGFFLLSNSFVWFSSAMYPHTAAGLMSCYEAALPFYGNDLVSTMLTAGVFFYLPVVAQSLVKGFREATESGQRMA